MSGWSAARCFLSCFFLFSSFFFFLACVRGANGPQACLGAVRDGSPPGPSVLAIVTAGAAEIAVVHVSAQRWESVFVLLKKAGRAPIDRPLQAGASGRVL